MVYLLSTVAILFTAVIIPIAILIILLLELTLSSVLTQISVKMLTHESIGFIEALKPVSTALMTTLITGLFLVPKLEVFFNTTSIYLAVITLILVRVSIFASFLNVTLLGSLAITIVTALISLLLGLTLGASFLATYYITT